MIRRTGRSAIARPGSARRRLLGLSLVETAVAMVMFAAMMGGFVNSLGRFEHAQSNTGVRNDLLRARGRAVRQLRRDLSQAGFTTVGGFAFPLIAADGNLAGAFPFTAHAAPLVVEGPSDELVLCLPQDGDDDGWPDFAGTDPVWNPDRTAYFLVPENGGTLNRLVRQEQNGRTATVCQNVVRFEVDLPVDTGFTIPLDAVRIRMRLRDALPNGLPFVVDLEEVVRLRNGGMAP